MRICNVAGQLVATLVDDMKGPGVHYIGWKGESDMGMPVSSGVYFYKLESKNYTKTRKMVVLK